MAKNLKNLYKQNKKYMADPTKLQKAVDEFLYKEHVKDRARRLKEFHPSMVSKGIHCDRWWYLMFSETKGEVEKEAFAIKSLKAVKIGSSIHDAWQNIYYKMGILEGMWKCGFCGYEFWGLSPMSCKNCMANLNSRTIEFKEIPFSSVFIKGHADGIINYDGSRFLLELKSIKNDETKKSSYKYGFEHLTKPEDDHALQAQIYMREWNNKVKESRDGYKIVFEDDAYTVKSITEHSDPDLVAAKTIGFIDKAMVIYVAKNSSESISFVEEINDAKVKYLYDKMSKIWVTSHSSTTREEKLEELESLDVTAFCYDKCQFGYFCKELQDGPRQIEL